jgi:hypothetical protein
MYVRVSACDAGSVVSLTRGTSPSVGDDINMTISAAFAQVNRLSHSIASTHWLRETYVQTQDSLP